MDDARFHGPIELLLLSVVRTAQPVHGYGVVEELHRAGGATLDVAEGEVYPALHALEAAGLVKSRWERRATRPRRLYELTTNGRAELARRRKAWADLSSAVDAVVDAKPWATPTI